MESSETNKNTFISGRFYRFGPFIESNCMPVDGGKWVSKVFRSGLFLESASGFESFAFWGSPVDEDEEYLFFVEWSGSCIVEKILPSYLRVIK